MRKRSGTPWRLTLAIVLTTMASIASAQAPIQIFYVPVPEEDALTAFRTTNAGVTDASVRTTIGITAAGDGTRLYYDHWEDGYETNISLPAQTTTQVWGDSLFANGAPPGCGADICDVVNAGDVFTLQNDVFANPRNPATILYDGRDKIATTLLVAITRAAWPVPTVNQLLAGSVEVVSTNDWGTHYEAPAGENFGPPSQMYEDARFVIMAQRANTIVRVDVNGDGVDDIVQTLGEGEVFVVDGVLIGSRVLTNLPVHVTFVTSDVGSNYEMRWYGMVPVNRWTDSYIAPVATTSARPTTVILYNRHPTALSVDVTTTAGTSTVNVPAGGVFQYTMAPLNSGALFESTDGRDFFAIANSDDNEQLAEWGHSLLPASSLAPAVKVGWAPGQVAPGPPPALNASPVWVTAATATTLNVDWNDDGTVDATVPIAAFESVRLFDTSDGDQTGARIFTTDGTLIAAAWGQDASLAVANSPALDLGTLVLPAPDVTILKNSSLGTDVNGNGLLDPGDTLLYTLFVLNTGVVDADDIIVTDTPDPYTTYEPGTTQIEGAPWPDDVAPSTPFPLDESGINLGTLVPGEGRIITYERQLGNPLPSPEQQIINVAEVTYGTGVVVTSVNVGAVTPPQFSVTKTSDLTSPAIPGQQVEYTIEITNTTPLIQTAISVNDPLPSGTSYVAESTAALVPEPASVRDLFNAALYTNNNGTQNWTTAWAEVGDGGGGAGAGEIGVFNDGAPPLRLRMGGSSNTITREANLSSFSSPTLTFLARRNSLDSTAEYVALEISTGGGPFVELYRFTGPSNDTTYTLFSFDLTPYISANTQIRFITPAGIEVDDALFVDDLQIVNRRALTVRDLFNTASYGNNDGTRNWSTTWIETGEDNVVGGGDVAIVTDGGAGPLRLVVKDDVNSAIRQVNLTGFTSPTLSFQRRQFGLDGGESVVVEVSAGGGPFTNLVTLTGNQTTYAFFTFDLTPYISPNTRIQFRSIGALADDEGAYFDDVQILASFPTAAQNKTNQAAAPSPLLDGDPADLVLPGDAFFLYPGETMTVTYSVVVDDPLVPFLPSIVNQAEVDSLQSLSPTFVSRLDAVAPGSMVGDRVWLDVDGDGVQDVGEVGLSNVRVRLFRDPDGIPGNGDEVVVGTAFTDGNGNYLFDRVYPSTGTFYAEVDSTTLPAGLLPSPGNNNGRGPSLTITGNDTFLANDFGYTAPAGTAVVGDRIWSDADADGVQDPGEIGIGGVTLRLIAPGPDGLFGNGDDVIAANATTASDGTYLFVGVAPGVYRVDVTDTGGALAGYVLTLGPEPSTSILLAAGDVDVSRDFGYRNPSLFSISNAVWDDEDGDGVRDPGEAGIAGVTVALRDSGGNLIGTAVTDASGNFQFSGLGNGNYTIDLTDTNGLLTNLQPTTAPSTAGQLAVTVAGASVSGESFGYRSLGTIGEVVWSDSDGDGVRDPGEPGIGGVTVQIIISGLDGLFGTADDSVIATTTTALDGTYRFTGLPQAYYRVQVTDTGNVLSGYTQTGDPDVLVDEQGNVPLLAGAVDLTMNFGYQNASLGDVSGTAFDDTDTDGVQDPGENGLTGVSLDLVAAGPDGIFGTIDDLIVATTFSDASGNYSFPDVPDGNYRVRVTDVGNVLNGYTLTSGLDQIPVTVAGADVTNVDFGYARVPGTGTIGTRVWLDANRDGVINPSEDGIGNVTVNLYTPGPDGVLGNGDDVLVDTVTTDSNGYYTFTGLGAGDYYVDVVQATLPPGLAPTVGTTDPTGRIQLADGQTYSGANFGYASAAGSLLGDSVFFDANGDGFQDPGEAGIGGVGVTVTGPSGTFNVVTDAAGLWLVAGLAPGNYTVTVNTATLPPGYNATPTNGPASRNFAVAAGADYLRADFGFDAPAGTTGTIGDTVFFDTNGNGVQNGGEGGISGVTVRLLNASGSVVATTTTGVNGSYDFVGVVPGDYTVEVTDIFGALAGLNLSAGSNPSGVVTLAAGGDVNSVDFGYTSSGGAGSIGGFVWHDTSGNGVVDGIEASLGIQGVSLRLYLDVNGNGVVDPGVDNLIRTTATDIIGEYQMNGLPPGNYLVDVTDTMGALAGFSKTAGAVGVDNNSQADPYAITLGSGTSNFTADFGYLAAGTNTIRGTTFFDVVGDGLLNGTDTGIDAVTVYLYRDLDGDGVLDVTDPRIGVLSSDINGEYAFGNLPSGSFIVAVDVTGTFLQSSFQTTQLATGGVQPVTLAAADSNGNHFGFNITATLVTLTRFDAYEDGGRVVVEWVTGSEVGTLGFYLFRWDPSLRRYEQVNDSLLPGLRAPQGGQYRLLDEEAPLRGSLAYLLYEVEEGGGERRYGPFRVPLVAGRTVRERLTTGFERRARSQSQAAIERAERARRRRLQTRLRREPPLVRRVRNDAAMKLEIQGTGVYFVSAARIAAALGLNEPLTPARIVLGGLRLSNRGESVAWLPAPRGSGIYFYGEELSTMYASENVYWLTVGRGRPVGSVDGRPALDGPDFHLQGVHLEEDTFAATLASTDPDSDFWYWSSLMASLPAFRTGTYGFQASAVHGASGTMATVDVHAYGATTTPHRLRVRVNGSSIGEGTFEGVARKTLRFELDPSLLLEGANTITVEAVLATGVAFDVVYVDSLDVSYPRGHVALSNRAGFTAVGPGTVHVTGFTTDDAQVVDVSSPHAPALVSGATRAGGAVHFEAQGDRRYFVFASTAVVEPEGTAVPTLTSLRAGGAEYLVVTPESLMEAAQELADHRESQGLKARVVTLETIHDELGFGIPSPHNLKAFLELARRTWSPAPRFVVLVGKGTYDFKDVQGKGDNLMPPLMAATPNGLYASDNRLADVVGNDGVPDLMIGRIPVLSDEELRQYLSKLQAFEGAGLGESLFLADNPDVAGNFLGDSEKLVALLPEGVGAHRVYLSQLTLAQARQELKAKLQAGVGYWNYIGHGGLDRFASEGLFLTTDVPSLTNSVTPFVASLTCSTGRFEVPGWASLGEALVMKENGGAVAAWTPSGLSYNSQALILNEALVESLYDANTAHLGEAIQSALQTFSDEGQLRFMLSIYNLLGDPATRIR
jgi:uncharacterized repeat protein (TIGR01451 family)